MCDHRAASMAWGEGQEPPAQPSGALRVLLVDDNDDVLQSLAVLLGLYGHEVLSCLHPREALAAAPAFAPHVCLLDIGLPGMNGHELASRLRANGLDDAQFIAVTGYGAHECRDASAAAGFALHLTKPVDPEHLLAHLAKVEDTVRARRASA